MEYEDKKKEILAEAKDFIERNGGYFIPEDEMILSLVWCGEKRDERIESVEFDDWGDLVVYTYADGNEEVTRFEEFSNEEMQEILSRIACATA